jgi:hypothetical protein
VTGLASVAGRATIGRRSPQRSWVSRGGWRRREADSRRRRPRPRRGPAARGQVALGDVDRASGGAGGGRVRHRPLFAVAAGRAVARELSKRIEWATRLSRARGFRSRSRRCRGSSTREPRALQLTALRAIASFDRKGRSPPRRAMEDFQPVVRRGPPGARAADRSITALLDRVAAGAVALPIDGETLACSSTPTPRFVREPWPLNSRPRATARR